MLFSYDFCVLQKVRNKNLVVLDVRSATHLEAFLTKQGVPFLHVSNVSGVCRGMHVWSHASYAEVCYIIDNGYPK